MRQDERWERALTFGRLEDIVRYEMQETVEMSSMIFIKIA